MVGALAVAQYPGAALGGRAGMVSEDGQPAREYNWSVFSPCIVSDRGIPLTEVIRDCSVFQGATCDLQGSVVFSYVPASFWASVSPSL